MSKVEIIPCTDADGVEWEVKADCNFISFCEKPCCKGSEDCAYCNYCLRRHPRHKTIQQKAFLVKALF